MIEVRVSMSVKSGRKIYKVRETAPIQADPHRRILSVERCSARVASADWSTARRTVLRCVQCSWPRRSRRKPN